LATVDVLQERPELWPVMTKTLVQAVASAGEVALSHAQTTFYAAGVADEKVRAAAALD